MRLCSLLTVALLLLPSTAPAVTVISSWGTTITTSNETYILTADLVEPPGSQGANDFAINIAPGVSHVTIDGGGFLIDGQDASGIPDDDTGVNMVGTAALPIRDVTVRNLRFTDIGNPVFGQDFLCNVLVEDCEFFAINDWTAIEFITLGGGGAVEWITIRENWIHDSGVLPIKLFNIGNAGATATFAHIYVVGNVIHNNFQSPDHFENWNAAIAIRDGGADIRVWDNIVFDNDGLSGLFIGSNDDPSNTYDEVSIRGNVFSGSTGDIRSAGTVIASGITLDRITTTSGTFSSWTVTGNLFAQNERAGIDLITGSGPTPLATSGNWWGEDGTVTGTYGNGAVNATDSAPLDLADGVLVLPDRAGIDRALSHTGGYLAEVFLLNQNNGNPGVRAFNIDYDFATSLAFEATVEGPFFRRQAPSTAFFDVARIGGTGNERSASGSILGGTAPLAVGNGILAVSVFRAGNEDLAALDDVDLDAVLLRDPTNQVVPVAGLDGADRRIDDTDPLITLSPTLGDTCLGTSTADIDLLVSDNFGLEDVFYRFHKATLDPGCYAPLARDEPGLVYTGSSPVTVTFAGGDGDYVFSVRATDDAGNATVADLIFNYDSTPPADFSGTTTAAAEPGPGTPATEEVRVSWDGSFETGGDLRLRYLPYGGAIGSFAYPEYDDDAPVPGPHFPTSSEGIEIDLPDVTAGSVTIPFSIAERSYYYFTLFVVDCAENVSPGTAADARASGLSYYLGDWDPASPPGCPGSPGYASGNGEVDFCDLIGLSAAFGTAEGEAGYEAHADIGPTTPGPGVLDLPATDNLTDFEDLILFAVNFENVSPLGRDLTLGDLEAGPPVIVLEAERMDAAPAGAITVRIRLTGNAEEVKGLEAVVGHGPGLEFTGARSGPALGAGAFFRALERGGGVSVNAVALAGTFRGSGTVAELDYVVRRPEVAESAGPELLRTKIRDRDNRELAGATVAAAVDRDPGMAPPIPAGLAAPTPNPAAGHAELRFAVSDAGSRTRIRIYDAAGHLVRVLVDRLLSAGEHRVEWDGRSDAGTVVRSGVYLIELESGPVRDIEKFILVR